jgi:flagellar basal body-associated protein FliL
VSTKPHGGVTRINTPRHTDHNGIIILGMILAVLVVLALSALTVLFLRSGPLPPTENRVERTTEKEFSRAEAREFPSARGLQQPTSTILVRPEE